MQVSLFQASVPVLIRGLTQLGVILDKAAVHAEAKKIDPAVLVNARVSGHVAARAASNDCHG